MMMLPLYNHDCVYYEEFCLSCTLRIPCLNVFELVTQLAVASTTITIDCTLSGCYNILYH